MSKEKIVCAELQALLVERGVAAVRGDAVVEEHLVGCAECFAFLEALAEVDSALARLPLTDAPDAVVAKTVAAVSAEAPASASAPPRRGMARRAGAMLLRQARRPRTWAITAMTAAVVLSASYVVLSTLQMRGSSSSQIALTPPPTTPAPAQYVVAEQPRRALRDFKDRESGRDRARATEPMDDLLGGEQRVAKVPAQQNAKAEPAAQEVAPGADIAHYNGPNPGAAGQLKRDNVETLRGRIDTGSTSTGLALAKDYAKGKPANKVLALDLAGNEQVPRSGESVPDKNAPEKNAPEKNAPEKTVAEVSGGLGLVGSGAGGGGIGEARGLALGEAFGRGAVGDLAGSDATVDHAATDARKLTRDELKSIALHKQGYLALREGGAVSGRKGGTTEEGANDADQSEVEQDAPAGPEANAAHGRFLATETPPEVKTGTPALVQGSLDAGQIRRVLAQGRPIWRACYERARALEPGLSGTITLGFIISPTGSVLATSVKESTLKNQGVEQCVTSAVGRLTFPAPAGGGIVNVRYPLTFAPGEPATTPAAAATTPAATAQTQSAEAQVFFAERRRTSGLVFQEPSGYWSNTYLPGDAAMRLLAAQLGQHKRTEVLGAMAQKLRLDDAARMVAQPFDAPDTAALAVYLQADRKSAAEPTRMLVQVGLKGSERHSRARPAMNVAVVLDLRAVPESKAALRALLEALGRAKDVGDRFSLVVAGAPGGMLLNADNFKHGPLAVAMQTLLDGGAPAAPAVPGEPASRGGTFDLSTAMQTAIDAVAASDDPNTPLGSSVVMLVTGAPLGAELPLLTEKAHAAAVAGVPVSVVGVGGNVALSELDQLAFAGQGNRRLLAAAGEAKELVERELSAVSRVVARALRLRVRLAPGVKLVEVIGAHRLDQERAQAVRQAEQSIDRRMSKNLGIASDRGEDEEGIQIVIPSFYAGDTHVVLLDVVAPGAGPVADVRVRYKDLVYLKNGVARANLRLERTPSVAGPLELNVLKNLLAYEVSQALAKAGAALAIGASGDVPERLDHMIAVLSGVRMLYPALALDPDVDGDASMLGEYRGVVTASGLGEVARGYLADSLKYAGFLKVLAR